MRLCCNIFLHLGQYYAIAISDFKVARHGYICESRWIVRIGNYPGISQVWIQVRNDIACFFF